MEKEKRMLGDYEIIHSISLGEYEIVVGENESAPKDERFACAFIEDTDLFEVARECLVGESYSELMAVFGKRIAEKAEDMQKETEQDLKLVGNDDPLTMENCVPLSEYENLEGHIVVIDPKILRHEYRRASHQLHICTGGFGSYPNARGRTVFCTSVLDGKKTEYWRQDILGVMPEDKLPEWAKAGLERYKNEQRKGERRHSERSER